MQIKTIVVAVLAAGLLVAGCGGGDLPVEEQSTLETREDALPSCNGQECHYDVPYTSPRTAFTCHEDCRMGCIDRYPDDRGMQDLCTWSCIDSECGGGPFPLQQ